MCYIYSHLIILPQASLDLPPATPSKVTLTNWVRLNNAPLLLPRASAVQWNDYVFVLARDGTALLYHTKHGIWSMLPKCPNKPAVSYESYINVPLVNYRGEILTVNKFTADIYAFDATTSSWKKFSGPPTLEIVHMAVNHDTLRVYAKSLRYSSLFRLTTEGWEEQGLFDNGLCSKILLASEYFFVETARGIYRQKINDSDEPCEPIKTIVLPPYKAFTLHVLKDTLLSFGGRDSDYQPTSDVLRYNPDTDTWESAGYMRSARYNVAVATVQQDNTTEVYVLGGEFGSTKLKMTPKLPTARSQTPADWDCSTSMVEKCTLSD